MISFIHIFEKIKQSQMGRKILFIVSQRFRKCMLVRFLCLVLLIGYAEADQTCAVGTSFCFDDDYMTVPMRDDNQYYIKPDGRPGADFIWFSSMFTTGSSIEKIESRTDGKIIRSIKFTESPTGEQGCPAGYKCTYYVNQLYGTLPLSSDLTSKVKNIVELSTRAQFEFYNYPLYYGDSMEATNYQTVIELEPNPYEDEVDKTDPFNSCESSRAEQSSSASKTSALVTPVKYQRFSFTKENALEGSIDLLTSSMKKQIKNRLLLLLKTGERIEGQVDVDALLEPLYSASPSSRNSCQEHDQW